MKMRNHKSLVETKSSHLRKITTVRRDLNEVYHFKTHDKFFTFRCKWGITNHWSRQNHHIKEKSQLFVETSMESIISKLTINFSHSDVNEESQIIGPDKIITFKKKQLLIKLQWSLSSNVQNFTIFFIFRWKWGIINHWSRQNHHI